MPFAVISSAVAIPSATGLPAASREFVIYESSFSDIVGVLVFYAALSSAGDLGAFALELFGGGAVSVVVALAASIALYVLINRIEGHVRFLPLLAGLVCLYAVGKALYLSPLIFVLVAGLVIGNPHLLDRVPGSAGSTARPTTTRSARSRASSPSSRSPPRRFSSCCSATGPTCTRSSIRSHGASPPRAWASCSSSRRLLLRMLRVDDAASLTWIAPRGLITVLLFLAAMQGGALDVIPVRRADAHGDRVELAGRARASRPGGPQDRARGVAIPARSRSRGTPPAATRPGGGRPRLTHAAVPCMRTGATEVRSARHARAQSRHACTTGSPASSRSNAVAQPSATVSQSCSADTA